MKKYILCAVLAFGMLASPVFASATGLTSTQIQSILSLLSAFGADSATIANVSTALNGGTPTTEGNSFCYNFNSDLSVGSSDFAVRSTGVDVDALTTILAKEIPSYTTDKGATNVFTENVAAVVVQFQEKYGIRQTGYVGPLTRGKLNALYGCSIQSKILPSVTVTYPNGGETIKYSNIYMAGDLYFNWTTSQKEKYTPTSNKKLYVIDSNGKVVRDDPVFSTMNLGDGNFRSSFPGERNLEVNGKYKIKVCDYLDYKEYCDLSDNYFTIVQ